MFLYFVDGNNGILKQLLVIQEVDANFYQQENWRFANFSNDIFFLFEEI